MTRFKKIFAVVGATALLAVSAPAVYAASGSDGYSGGNVVAGLEKGGKTPADTKATQAAGTTPVAQTTPVKTAAAEQGSLPFTGADLGVLAAAGGILMALGFGLRRLTHRPSV